MNKETRVCGRSACRNKYAELIEHRIYLGKVKDFVQMDIESWASMRQSILVNFGGVHCYGTDHQYSKLAFTCKIDEMRKEV